jgi:hypothetical protein
MSQADASKMDRRKATMVLGVIEQSLGSFVLENGNDIEGELLGFTDIKIQDAVEEGYLNDIFQLAIEFSKGTPKSNSVKQIYQMFVDLDIWEVRNCCAHPNRPWRQNFWYKIALIASDQAFYDLGLASVSASLHSAERGELVDPPEGWDKKYTRSLPNNLPDKIESQITGLIGRDKELAELQKIISNKRNSSIAIVAPGGVGKTALALNLLKTIATSPKSGQWVDALVYVTLKTELWNGDEFEALQPGQEISSVENSITLALSDILEEHIVDLDHAIDAFGDRRIIICIDNLETLLRDNQHSFYQLTERLPFLWKVVVTSRVMITNAFIYSLKELKLAGATHLARTYNKNRGGHDLHQEGYEKIAEHCFFNPLAIKMALDMILSGKEFPASISAAKENIASYSFSELIECLSDNCMEVLEMMFAEPQVSRSRICQILGLTIDSAASAINELANTSLITRIASENIELYEINGLVRELLLVDPQSLKVRDQVHFKISSAKATAKNLVLRQTATDTKIWDKKYIPEDAEDGLKMLLSDFPKIRFNIKSMTSKVNNENIAKAYGALSKVKDNYATNPIFHRFYAFLKEEYKAFIEAEMHYKKALDLDPKDILTQYHFARFYYNKHDYLQSKLRYWELVKKIENPDVPDIESDFQESIYQGFFLSCLRCGEPDEVLKHTTKWKDHSDFRSLFGTFRASAYKRKVEEITVSDPENVVKYLTSATRILGDVFRSHGYTKTSASEGSKIIAEIEYCFCRSIYAKSWPDLGEEFLAFASEHLKPIADANYATEMSGVIRGLQNIDLPSNPFKERSWQVYILPAENLHKAESIEEEFVEIVVTRIPSTGAMQRKNFMFAEDNQKTQYFIHHDNIQEMTKTDWQRLYVGSKIACIKFEKDSDPHKTALTLKAGYLLE